MIYFFKCTPHTIHITLLLYNTFNSFYTNLVVIISALGKLKHRRSFHYGPLCVNMSIRNSNQLNFFVCCLKIWHTDVFFVLVEYPKVSFLWVALPSSPNQIIYLHNQWKCLSKYKKKTFLMILFSEGKLTEERLISRRHR